MVFTICVHGGHLDNVTCNLWFLRRYLKMMMDVGRQTTAALDTDKNGLYLCRHVSALTSQQVHFRYRYKLPLTSLYIHSDNVSHAAYIITCTLGH